jgi:hypothetical protein
MKKFWCMASLTLAAVLPASGVCSAAAVTADVPTGSIYYDYLDRLSSLGYLDSLPDGAQPYSRLLMARYVMEAQEHAKTRPMPAFLADQLKAMEKAFAPEIETLRGKRAQDDLALRSASAEFTEYHADQASYPETRAGQAPLADWQPFGRRSKGVTYQDGFQSILKAEYSGNIGHQAAVSLTPRLELQKGGSRLKLEEGYVKTQIGCTEFLLGREAVRYGQGTAGHFVLDDSAEPMTMLQIHSQAPEASRGFLRFLGKQDYHAFYARLEGDRENRGLRDYDHVGLLGLRADFTPASWATVGLMRVSMLGGNGNGLSRTDWRHWFTAHNDDAAGDRWNDIAGGDFRLRFPGVQLYGEIYGEDAAHMTPTQKGYRLGVYLPRLDPQGAWDFTAELAKNDKWWYVHQKYRNGWTYRGHMLGDDMGNDGRRMYFSVQHYLLKEMQIGLYYSRTAMNHGWRIHPTIHETGLTGRCHLGGGFYLDGELGLAKIDHAEGTLRSDRDVFASTTLRWFY